jgi:hypothetical protein
VLFAHQSFRRRHHIAVVVRPEHIELCKADGAVPLGEGNHLAGKLSSERSPNMW